MNMMLIVTGGRKMILGRGAAITMGKGKAAIKRQLL